MKSLVSIEDFRRAARWRLPRAVFDFMDGGAEDELTLNANRNAFLRRQIVPRVLNDVSHPDISTVFLRRTYKTPLIISPMGACGLIPNPID